MSVPKLGVVLRAEDTFFRSARASDPCDVVVLRSSLLNPPRRAAALNLGQRLRKVYPNAEVWPLVWHYVSHRKEDGLAAQATRTIEGEAANFGHLQETPETAAAWQTTLNLAQTLGAAGVVLRTPPSFSSGNLGQTRLAKFAEKVKGCGLRLLWEPDGLWTVERAAAVASLLDIDVARSSASSSTDDDTSAGRWARTWVRIDADLRADQAETLIAEAIVQLDSGAPGVTHILCDGPRAHANLRTLGRELEEYA